ncbi:MAG: T9SS type A sorting domain-containing protein, partial [Bacteroidales bacterium]
VPLTLANIPGEAFPTLNSLPAPTDTDQDGMPNDWEIANGLDTNNAADRNNIAADGYTMLEKYLNSIEFTNKVEGIALIVKSDNYIKITWADHFLGEDGYIIERAIPGNAFSVLDSVNANSIFLIDSSANLKNEYIYRVKAFNASNESQYSSEVSYIPTAVNEMNSISGMAKIYPNPFKDEVNFDINIPAETKVVINIIDINGAIVRNISNQIYGPGIHTITWKVAGGVGCMLQSGVYFCKITIGNDVQVQKLTYFK